MTVYSLISFRQWLEFFIIAQREEYQLRHTEDISVRHSSELGRSDICRSIAMKLIPRRRRSKEADLLILAAFFISFFIRTLKHWVQVKYPLMKLHWQTREKHCKCSCSTFFQYVAIFLILYCYIFSTLVLSLSFMKTSTALQYLSFIKVLLLIAFYILRDFKVSVLDTCIFSRILWVIHLW